MAVPLQSLADTLLGLLFPDRCAGCSRVGSLLCDSCRATLRPYPANRHAAAANIAGRRPLLDQAAVAFYFEGPLREAIHCLKYDHVQRMAAPLGDLLAHYMQQYPLPADAIIPVPLHPRRLAERGFNQSELLARRLAALHGLPILAAGLARRRDTAHQVGLDAQARRENVRDAFVWAHNGPPPARVLLIDDVLTTGATLGACAHALRAAGTREVRALVLARSQDTGSDR